MKFNVAQHGIIILSQVMKRHYAICSAGPTEDFATEVRFFTANDEKKKLLLVCSHSSGGKSRDLTEMGKASDRQDVLKQGNTGRNQARNQPKWTLKEYTEVTVAEGQVAMIKATVVPRPRCGRVIS